MMYVVKDQEFPVGGSGKQSGLDALTAAIRLAVEYAQAEDVDVFRVDETGVHVAYRVDRQPPKTERTGFRTVK